MCSQGNTMSPPDCLLICSYSQGEYGSHHYGGWLLLQVCWYKFCEVTRMRCLSWKHTLLTQTFCLVQVMMGRSSFGISLQALLLHHFRTLLRVRAMEQCSMQSGHQMAPCLLPLTRMDISSCLALVPQMIDCVRWVPTLLEQDPLRVFHVDRTVQERHFHHITKCYIWPYCKSVPVQCRWCCADHNFKYFLMFHAVLPSNTTYLPAVCNTICVFTPFLW